MQMSYVESKQTYRGRINTISRYMATRSNHQFSLNYRFDSMRTLVYTSWFSPGISEAVGEERPSKRWKTV
jgi:hypothetical protein